METQQKKNLDLRTREVSL